MGRRRKHADTARSDIARVMRARDSADEAEARFRWEVFRAHTAGTSLRAIGEALGVSHASVRKIVVEQRARRDAAEASLARPISGTTPSAREREKAARLRLAAKWDLPVPDLDA